MKRYGLLILSLGMVCFWLIGSYLPQIEPIQVLQQPLPDSVFGGLAVFCFVLFLGIQLWILFSTHQSLDPQANPQLSEIHTANRHVKRGLELFWTALPIVLTLLLAWRSWIFWQIR